MTNDLSTLHGNTIVLLDRVELNLVMCFSNAASKKSALVAEKVLKKVLDEEVKTGKPCMDVPVRVSDVKRIFPNYLTNPPSWRMEN